MEFLIKSEFLCTTLETKQANKRNYYQSLSKKFHSKFYFLLKLLWKTIARDILYCDKITWKNRVKTIRIVHWRMVEILLFDNIYFCSASLHCNWGFSRRGPTKSLWMDLVDRKQKLKSVVCVCVCAYVRERPTPCKLFRCNSFPYHSGSANATVRLNTRYPNPPNICLINSTKIPKNDSSYITKE